MNEILPVRIRSKNREAEGVVTLILERHNLESFPAFEPGAHIDLHLPNGVVRQYSLCGEPSDLSSYRIAVRAVEGGSCSQFIYHELKTGDILKIGPPRNNFPLLRSERYLFIAGGIGITPLIPMMRQADKDRRNWVLIYCKRTGQKAPFIEEISALHGIISLHGDTQATMWNPSRALAEASSQTLVYCCGPESLMRAVEEATSGWPKDAVRFEWFKPRTIPARDDESFDVRCEPSGLTVTVPPGRSILDVLREAGLDVPSSCEQGVCGSCETRVIDGMVDHRDSCLSADERATNRTMMICVSRAVGKRLVLDI